MKSHVASALAIILIGHASAQELSDSTTESLSLASTRSVEPISDTIFAAPPLASAGSDETFSATIFAAPSLASTRTAGALTFITEFFDECDDTPATATATDDPTATDDASATDDPRGGFLTTLPGGIVISLPTDAEGDVIIDFPTNNGGVINLPTGVGGGVISLPPGVGGGVIDLPTGVGVIVTDLPTNTDGGVISLPTNGGGPDVPATLCQDLACLATATNDPRGGFLTLPGGVVIDLSNIPTNINAGVNDLPTNVEGGIIDTPTGVGNGNPNEDPVEVIEPDCPACSAGNAFLTTYTTVYATFCPTGLEDKEYTIIETRSGKPGDSAPENTSKVAPGFGVTTAVCTKCGPAPITATLTVPTATGAAAGGKVDVPVTAVKEASKVGEAPSVPKPTGEVSSEPESSEPDSSAQEKSAPGASSPDSPKADAPEADSPGSESPESESPESESPESESPESNAPESESPESESPKSNAPESDSPESDAPESDAPESDAPESDSPASDSSAPDSAPDSTEDSPEPGSSEPDTASPDTSAPEAVIPEAGRAGRNGSAVPTGIPGTGKGAENRTITPFIGGANSNVMGTSFTAAAGVAMVFVLALCL
ncbi:MAG: hypothetical protein M1837_001848 [Sclerophora amabilis]|nr:MAG: hypothetical protein M1837_001848 [Sclerophora amabilis]